MATTTRPTEERREYEQQFIDEVWNGREFDLVLETISEDYVGHWFDPEVGDVDREGLVSFIEAAHEGFSDLHMEAEFMLAEDDMIAVGFTISGTHDGEYMGIPPTGEYGESPGIFVHRFGEAGKVVEAWAVWDALGQMQQLGVVPETFTLVSFLETGANRAKQDILKLAKGRGEKK
jgi:steroid delta-isomerase-like uncharacterized protein